MKILRCLYNGRTYWCELQEDEVHFLASAPFEGLAFTGQRAPLDQVRLLCPALPGKVLCVALNDPEHIRETGKPTPQVPSIFMKPASCLIGPEEAVRYPEDSQRVDPEAELALVIGKTARNVSPQEAMDYVFGFTCANDVSDRTLQKKSGQWCAAKGRDTFGPLGPWIETAPSAPLTVRLLVNGQCRQSFAADGLIFSPAQIVSFLSHAMTLQPGDVILSGTGAGIAPVQPGDVMTVVIEGIGELTNRVTSEK